jgi:hypothetical protein
LDHRCDPPSQAGLVLDAEGLVRRRNPVAGRPTKLIPEVADDLVLMLGAGVPIAVAARAVSVSERSVER